MRAMPPAYRAPRRADRARPPRRGSALAEELAVALLHAALERLGADRVALEARDGHGRTPLHVATFARQRDAIRALARAGADLSALENDRYDAVTIASVADDEETLRVLLELGGHVSSGGGVSTDILEASGKAYLRALSNALAKDVAAEAERLLEREAKKTPTP